MNLILIRPIISEKSMKMAADGLYTFVVGKAANKLTVAKSVSDRFKVNVLSVKITNTQGEIKMQRKVRKYYKTATVKKALVQVKKGQTIPVFEMPTEEAEVITADEPKVIKEKRNLLGRTKVKVEKTAVGAAQSTQRKVITGK